MPPKLLSTPRKLMEDALQRLVVSRLRTLGFKGSFPHFRRMGSAQIDLLSFQFDKWGGGFVVEIAKCPPQGVRLPWGEEVPPEKVKAGDLHPTDRLRLQPKLGGSPSDWFRYDKLKIGGKAGAWDGVAETVLPYLDIAERWWRGEDHQYIREYEAHRRSSG
jgi:hypothetical protein